MKITQYVAGTQINIPGWYSGVPMDAYHGDLCSGPSISSSGLRTIEAKSALHYYSTSYLNPNREPQEPKDHFSFGRAAHTLLLGEEGFRAQFAVRPEQWTDWRTKDAQAWKREQQAAGRDVLTTKDLDAIKGIAASLGSHYLVKSGILQGLIEHTIVAQDPVTGVWLKSRPDVLPVADGVLVDIKTTTDASPRAVERTVLDFNYAMQGGLASMVMKSALDFTVTDFVLVFVEKAPPYAVNVTPIDPEWIHYGRRQLRRAIDRFAKCVETNTWPGYDEELTTSMPDWLRKKFEAEDKGGLLPEEKAA